MNVPVRELKLKDGGINGLLLNMRFPTDIIGGTGQLAKYSR